jgi:hypothetical protein
MSETATHKHKPELEDGQADNGALSPDCTEISSIHATPATVDPTAEDIAVLSGLARTVIYCSKEIAEEQDEPIPLGPNVLGTFSCHGLLTF